LLKHLEDRGKVKTFAVPNGRGEKGERIGIED
jgi:hypothetical protein